MPSLPSQEHQKLHTIIARVITLAPIRLKQVQNVLKQTTNNVIHGIIFGNHYLLFIIYDLLYYKVTQAGRQ